MCDGPEIRSVITVDASLLITTTVCSGKTYFDCRISAIAGEENTATQRRSGNIVELFRNCCRARRVPHVRDAGTRDDVALLQIFSVLFTAQRRETQDKCNNEEIKKEERKKLFSLFLSRARYHHRSISITRGRAGHGMWVGVRGQEDKRVMGK